MHEGEPEEPVRVAGHDRGHLAVRDRVVGVEGGEQYRPRDSRGRRAAQVPVQLRAGVPRSGESVAGTRVAVTVDNHAATFADPIAVAA